ncbi:endo-1,4-beta-xylanase, partial [uncultured Proteiniphilum sp.]|uniref:endo-1,4-beta-xylanase n=1 Tax=uncultured Proteiniphilum sp. TaxID=497637 RepID=UPI0026335CD6
MSEAYWKIWNPEVQRQIDRDIEKHRKADGELTLTDIAPGTEVKIEQISHDFIFGAHIFNYNQLGKTEYNDRYKELYGTLFNSATVAFYWKTFEMQPNRPRYKEEYWDTESYWNNIAEPKKEPHWRRPASDPVIEFCEKKGIRIHGHPIIWGNRKWHNPNWIIQNCMIPEEKAKMDELIVEYGDLDNYLDSEKYA